MACSSSCRTKDHKTFGECLRAKNLSTAGAAPTSTGYDRTKEKKHYSRIEAYAAARRQGIQPESTRMKDIETAVRLSNDTGVAFNANPKR